MGREGKRRERRGGGSGERRGGMASHTAQPKYITLLTSTTSQNIINVTVPIYATSQMHATSQYSVTTDNCHIAASKQSSKADICGQGIRM